MKQVKELKWYGFNACMAMWKKRPYDIDRVFILKENLTLAKGLLRWCAKERKLYRIVSSEEMSRITDSHNHEGICIVGKAPKLTHIENILSSPSLPKVFLYLDGVQNPHNIGSIIRVCAHFGLLHILGEKKTFPNISPSMFRIAEGGLECVQIVPLESPLEVLRQFCQMGYRMIATSSHKGCDLYHYAMPEKVIIVIGAEDNGVSKSLFKFSQECIQIPGSQRIESLNVSVATGLILGELWRQGMFS